VSDDFWTQAAQEPTDSNDTDDSLIEQQLAADLINDLQEAWADKAVKQYPNVAPLRAHLRGNSKEEVLAQAKSMSESLKEANPGPAMTGGSPALPPLPTDEEELAEIRQRAARTHSERDYSAYLRKKFEMAGVEYPGYEGPEVRI
jgi:hypothetical protein